MDASDSTWEWILLVGLLLLSALLSGFETALFSANRLRLRHLAGEGHAGAATALRLVEAPGRALTALLLAITALWIAAAVLATEIVAARLGLGVQAFWATALGMTVVILLLGEIAPKTMASRRADRIALLAARPVSGLTMVLSPVIYLLSQVGNVLVRPFGGRVSLTSPLATEEEIRTLVAMGEEEGVIERDEREMIHSIFEFGDTVAREVMVPRIDMVCVEDSAALDEVLTLILEHGHSRIPVYHETIDRVVGIVHAKDLLRRLQSGSRDGRVGEIMRPAMFVPETKKVDELFREMRRSKTHMTIVVDEYGGTAGLLTIEDLLEEIVGEIQDEYDVEEPMVKVLDERTAVVDGRMNIDEVNDLLGLSFPADEVDTIGGFVYRLLGRVPEQGEVVSHNSVQIGVERTDGQRITRVRIHKLPKDVEPAGTL